LLALVAAGFVIGALGLVALATLTRPADLPQPTATVVFLTAPPVTTPLPTPTIQAPPTLEPPTPTATVPPPPPGEVKVGAYVQVIGTGDAGVLNLRAEASIRAGVNYLAIEREVFQVQAGPQTADGFTWWLLVDPATSSRSGWAAQNYLQAVQGP
jgi:hypothetical protein